MGTLSKQMSVDLHGLPHPASLCFYRIPVMRKYCVLCYVNIYAWKDFYTRPCLSLSLPWEPNLQKPIKDF